MKVFGDGDEFVDEFLIQYYSRSRMLTAECEGRMAAMLHILPFDTGLGRASYIYGVATDPEFRNRGLASQLLREALRLCDERGDDAVFLIPTPDKEWLRGFYGRFGFSGAVPAEFRTPDGFDFGTGDPATDLAMIRLRRPGTPLPERLVCSYVSAAL